MASIRSLKDLVSLRQALQEAAAEAARRETEARIEREQNAVSRDIAHEKHDAQTGNPQSASSQRMQHAVQGVHASHG